jgi:hypothetical protein
MWAWATGTVRQTDQLVVTIVLAIFLVVLVLVASVLGIGSLAGAAATVLERAEAVGFTTPFVVIALLLLVILWRVW